MPHHAPPGQSFLVSHWRDLSACSADSSDVWRNAARCETFIMNWTTLSLSDECRTIPKVEPEDFVESHNSSDDI
jgi:hypothetical protein